MKVAQPCPTFCDPMDYTVWNSPGQNTVGSLSLLQGIFPTQILNPGLPQHRQILYQLRYQGSPIFILQMRKPKIQRLYRVEKDQNPGLWISRPGFSYSWLCPCVFMNELFPLSELQYLNLSNEMIELSQLCSFLIFLCFFSQCCEEASYHII